MKEIDRTVSSMGVRRVYYTDNNGDIIEKMIHSKEDHAPIILENMEQAAAFRAHDGSNVRHIASIPVDIYLAELHKHDIREFTGNDALDMVTSKILTNPDYQYLKRVPQGYRHKQH
jgi:hypothetical protein